MTSQQGQQSLSPTSRHPMCTLKVLDDTPGRVIGCHASLFVEGRHGGQRTTTQQAQLLLQHPPKLLTVTCTSTSLEVST